MDYAAIGRRIREARESAGLTQRELGKQLGYSQTAINGWETARRRISLDDLEHLSRALNRPLAWFLGAEASGAPLESYLARALEKPLGEFLSLKVIPILRPPGAGGSLFDKGNVVGTLTISRDLAGDFAVKVPNDSMSGAGLFAGDLAVCRRTPEATSGQMVVAVDDRGEVTIRYLVDDGASWKLRAAAPGQPDLPFDEERTRVEGVVDHIIHRPPPEEKAIREVNPPLLYPTGHPAELTAIIREGAVSYQGTPLSRDEKDLVLKAVERAIRELRGRTRGGEPDTGKEAQEDLDPELVKQVAIILRELRERQK